MKRSIVLIAITPFLASCGLEELFNPGQSKQRSEYRASITAPTSPTIPVESPTEVTDGVSPSWLLQQPEPEITVAQEPVYVPPEPKPDCTADLYMIYKCVEGRVVMI